MAIRKVNVQPAVDKNGVPLPPDYVTQVRENLGSPSDYTSEGETSERKVEMDVMSRNAEGNSVIVPHVHTFTRVDH